MSGSGLGFKMRASRTLKYPKVLQRGSSNKPMHSPHRIIVRIDRTRTFIGNFAQKVTINLDRGDGQLLKIGKEQVAIMVGLVTGLVAGKRCSRTRASDVDLVTDLCVGVQETEANSLRTERLFTEEDSLLRIMNVSSLRYLNHDFSRLA